MTSKSLFLLQTFKYIGIDLCTLYIYQISCNCVDLNLADGTLKKYYRFKGNNPAASRSREISRCVIHIFLLLVQELFNSKMREIVQYLSVLVYVHSIFLFLRWITVYTVIQICLLFIIMCTIFVTILMTYGSDFLISQTVG